MKNSILLSIFLTIWASSALAINFDGTNGINLNFGYDTEDNYPEYEKSCDEQRMREYWMSDEEYSNFLYEFQETECATIYKLGDTGIGGGRVFLITDEGRHGLETSPVQIKNVEWGCHGVSIPGTKVNIGTGKANTDKTIEANCSPYFDNELVSDLVSKSRAGGFSDWYVPSRHELYKIFDVLGVHKVLEKSDPNLSYPSYFWSSTQANNEYNYVQNLTTGAKCWSHKALTLSLLPIRNF